MNFEQSYDIVVCGGGVAGVAAALEAARSGHKTAFVEKTIIPGGLATAGLIFYYLPLCDGNGHQVSFGIAEELLHLSMKYGPGEIPAGWRQARNANENDRYIVFFSPASFVLALDEVLEEAGVSIWLDTLAVAATKDGDRVVGLEVETKGGRGLLNAHCVVDATGDADIAHRAGVECVEGGNILTVWEFQASLEKASQAVKASEGAYLIDLVSLGDHWSGLFPALESHDRVGTDAETITQFVLDGRRLIRQHYAKLHAAGGDTRRDAIYPLLLPAMPQFRMIRHIVGRTILQPGSGDTYVEDSIGMCADWRKSGPIWEIPHGALLPAGVRGLLAAGRCISAEGDAWDVTRVIPPAAVTGQAAGAIASLAVEQRSLPDEIPVSDVQSRLRERSIPLHREEVFPSSAKSA